MEIKEKTSSVLRYEEVRSEKKVFLVGRKEFANKKDAEEYVSVKERYETLFRYSPSTNDDLIALLCGEDYADHAEWVYLNDNSDWELVAEYLRVWQGRNGKGKPVFEPGWNFVTLRTEYNNDGPDNEILLVNSLHKVKDKLKMMMDLLPHQKGK